MAKWSSETAVVNHVDKAKILKKTGSNRDTVRHVLISIFASQFARWVESLVRPTHTSLPTNSVFMTYGRNLHRRGPKIPTSNRYRVKNQCDMNINIKCENTNKWFDPQENTRLLQLEQEVNILGFSGTACWNWKTTPFSMQIYFRKPDWSKRYHNTRAH